MCGIAGFFDPRGSLGTPGPLLGAMGRALAHRGPDGEGIWVESDNACGFVHRRLSIIDVSPTGAQPMASADGRFIITFNGEIYNYRELQEELERATGPRTWRGTSDTEVLLAAIDRWGAREAIGRANGMFAFALWDRTERTLTLARDRFGEKPLYYTVQNGVLAFASELKALRTLPRLSFEIDREAVELYLRFGYVPGTKSIYRGVMKLAPACTAVAVLDGTTVRLESPQPYWSALALASAGQADRITADPASMVEMADVAIRRAVALRMNADVPLGAFLSGGIDSSTVVAAMQAQSTRPVRTFSIGFESETYNEAADARRVAEHLGTDHTELVVSAADALAVVPRLPLMYDEPFADSSQIPTFLVSQLARRSVTVALSGDGGDELFGGYNRHVWAPRVWQRLARQPVGLRRFASRLITATPAVVFRSGEQLGSRFFPALRHRGLDRKALKLARVLAAGSENDLYRRLCSVWDQPPVRSRQGAAASGVLLTDESGWPAGLPYAERMMALDAVTYLPDDILAKVDRASMATSLEARVPLLDPELFAFAWRVPQAQKVDGDTGKWLLRQVLYRYVPAAMVDRPKAGFGIPLHDWLRGPLREWAEDLLSETALGEHGLLDSAAVRRVWLTHLAGHGAGEHALWAVLMLQAWLRHGRS